jgi:hypothetical protein
MNTKEEHDDQKNLEEENAILRKTLSKYEQFFGECEKALRNISNNKNLLNVYKLLEEDSQSKGLEGLSQRFHELLASVKSLERTILAYEAVSELARHEHLVLDRVNKAYEQLIEFNRLQRLEHERLGDIHEEVQKLSRHELVERDEIIWAYQMLERMVSEEMKYNNKIIEALEAVCDLARVEQIEKDQLLKEKNELIRDKERMISQLHTQIEAIKNQET